VRGERGTSVLALTSSSSPRCASFIVDTTCGWAGGAALCHRFPLSQVSLVTGTADIFPLSKLLEVAYLVEGAVEWLTLSKVL
jgi:hypothetical protein